jgi:hypothetical protein
MIDPFFYDRLLHAFTTANATPLSQAASHATGDAAACRALREAEEVVAAVFRRERTALAKTDQPADHTQGG